MFHVLKQSLALTFIKLSPVHLIIPISCCHVKTTFMLCYVLEYCILASFCINVSFIHIDFCLTATLVTISLLLNRKS
jgi:hypothetical protein